VLALGAALPMAANAAKDDLGAPIVELMPHFKALRADLNLNAEQNATIDAWIAEAPTKRAEMEEEMRVIRSELRDAILNGDSRLRREELKQQLAAKELRLVEMRSLCARMLRTTLDQEQYARVVARYRAAD
jgi:hypothetical protein